MSSGSVQLKDVMDTHIRVECLRCNKRQRFEVLKLIKEHGGDIRLPDLKWKLTKCDKNDIKKPHDYCVAKFDKYYGR